MKLGIFLPTYKRPYKLQEVATNIEKTTKSDFTLYFGCEAADTESIEAAKATGHTVVVNAYDPQFGYSNTIQTIYEQSDEPVFFHANDDFEFLEGWDEAPMRFLAEHPEVMVLGAHDGMPTPSYSTISFIRREYIEDFSGVVDIPNRVFYTYGHNYIDTELTYTAQARGLWAKIETPCIKHHRTGGDETYKKNDVTSPQDANTFKSREHLWKNINKEEILEMAKKRKPMTEEQKQHLRDLALARAEAKKAEVEKDVEPTPTDDTARAGTPAEGGKALGKQEVAEPQPEESKTVEASATADDESVSDSRPPADETTKAAMVGRAIEHMNEAFETLILVRNENLDMIEASQAVEALTEARNRAGQVQGLISSE